MAAPNSDVVFLLKEVQAKGERFTCESGDQDARTGLLESARDLVAALESPFEVIARMNWLEPSRWAVTRVGLDLKLFEALLADNATPKTTEKLAEVTGCDPLLLSRILKHLVAGRFVDETGVETYTANGITAALATRIPAGMTKNCYDYMNKSHATLPQYLRESNYINPTNKDASPFKYGMGTDLHYFDWINQPGKEQELEDFKAHMEFKTLGKKWFESVDVPAILGAGVSGQAEDEVLMVDIGGSFGHDIRDFHKAFPNVPGKLILQDLPATISAIPPNSLPPAIEAQAYDFFTPQFVRDAKIYYLHMVLHDWPDESCRKILRNIIPSMKKGYSKILLNEIVIPNQGAGWFETSVDILMMVVHASQERTEGRWRELAESVGLKITKIWPCGGNPEKIVELELA